MFLKLIILGIACGMVTLTLVPGNKTLLAGEDPESSKAVKMLLSEDFAEQKQGQEQILSERASLVSQLAAIISAPENHVRRPASVAKAMSLLGELRAPEGIEVLVEYIGFPYVKHPKAGEYPGPDIEGGTFGKTIEQLLPAIPALVKIGEPCIDEVINKLWTTDGGLERKACMAVLRKLSQHTSVHARLEKKIERSTPRAPDSLREVLKMLGKEAISEEK